MHPTSSYSLANVTEGVSAVGERIQNSLTSKTIGDVVIVSQRVKEGMEGIVAAAMGEAVAADHGIKSEGKGADSTTREEARTGPDALQD